MYSTKESDVGVLVKNVRSEELSMIAIVKNEYNRELERAQSKSTFSSVL
jgi:hypothetical protein